jgi:hypothetical protein
MNKRSLTIIMLALLALSMASSTAWEGSAVPAAGSEFPSEGLYAACNSFPRGSTVEVSNLETGRVLSVTISGTVDNPGIFMILSPQAAEALGMKSGSAARIRASSLLSIATPAASPAASARTGSSASRDPDFNPALLATPERVAAGRAPLASPPPQAAEAVKVPELAAAAAATPPPAAAPIEGSPQAEVAAIAEEALSPQPDRVQAESPAALDPRSPANLSLVLAEPEPRKVELPPKGGEAEPLPPESPESAASEAEPCPESLPEDILARQEAPRPSSLVGLMAPEPLEPAGEEALPESGPEVYVDGSQPELARETGLDLAGIPALPEIVELLERPGLQPRLAQLAIESPPADAAPDIALLGGEAGGEPEAAAEAVAEAAAEAGALPLEAALPHENAEVLSALVAQPDSAEADKLLAEAQPPEAPATEAPELAGSAMLPPLASLAEEEGLETEPAPIEAQAVEAASAAGEQAATEPEGIAVVSLVPAEARPPQVAPSAAGSKGSAASAIPSPVLPPRAASPAAVAPASATSPVPAALPERMAFVDKLAKGSFYVQVGVFSGSASIAEVASSLGARYPLSAERVASPGGERIRLYVGPLGRDEGGVVLLDLRAKGFKDAFIKAGS